MVDFLFQKTFLLFFTTSFWRDEAFTYLLSHKKVGEILFLTAKDFNPPLYYLLVHFWTSLFGSTEISIRTISLIFYWFTIFVCYQFLTQIFKFSQKKSFIYLLLFIFNPILIYYACEARMYSMFTFLSTASIFFFLKRNSKLYILTTFAGLMTHYYMIFTIILQIFMFFIEEKSKILQRKNLFLIIPIILFSPWFLFMELQKNIKFSSFWIQPTALKTFLDLPALIYTGYEHMYYFYNTSIEFRALILWVIICFGLFIFFKKKPEQKKYFLFYFIWGLVLPFGIAGISIYKPIFLTRYLIFSSVGMVFLLITIINQTPKIIQIITITLLLIISLQYHQSEIQYRKKSDYRKIITEIKKLAKPIDILYVTNELDYFTAQYYFDEDRVFIYGKSYEDLPDYVGKILIPETKLVYQLPKYPVKAFILTSDSHYDVKTMY